ncbi:MAG TPA: outer membrane protein assembly factor BamD [Acidobacteriaceae bacterium]|nr:outer membrane protein assembly factor BamD [Acidobacteriaceae bacterium]
MNRLGIRISAAGLGVAMALTPCAFAKHRKQKDYNISENALKNVKSQQPDKILYDKAMVAMKKGHYDVARLDLQTLLNTYSESEYAMRAKMAVGDTWFKEGGSAALAQAELEYKDFITFFPNSPEAAEAQMKVGDIYFMQMEKPDRDPQNALSAEREYRTMLEQFPDSPLIPEAKQKLREVQEVLAQRQFEIGEYYFSVNNWAAAIARLQTVSDTYPLFSKSDQTLISIGDAYANWAAFVSHYRIPERAKEELETYYDQRAAAAWDRVCTQYPLSAHVEDAKDRLIAMGLPVPEPTPAELAESQAEEDSRVPVKLGKRTLLLLEHGPSTVHAARVGEPSLTTPPPVIPKDLNEEAQVAFIDAMRGKPIPRLTLPGQPAPTQASAASAQTPGSEGGAVQTLEFGQVPTASNGNPGNSVGVQVVGEGGSAGVSEDTGAAPSAAPTSAPAAAPLVAPVGPTNNQPLPPVDKPAAAPAQINEVPAGSSQQMPATPATAHGKKNPKPKFYKKDESSNKHRKKKGLDKLNPF